MSFDSITYNTACLYEKGGRQVNEDSLGLMDVLSGSSHLLFAAVADGIGGLDNGAYASSYTVRRLKRCFEEVTLGKRTADLKYMSHCLLKEIYGCHRYLKGTSESSGFRSGTTLTLLCLVGRRGIAIGIGDSHLYHMRRRARLTQGAICRVHLQAIRAHVSLIGRDHTDRCGRLTRCIGQGTYHRIKVHRIKVKKGDTLLLCTDGFYKLAERQIYTFAQRADCECDETGLSDHLNRVYRYISSMGEKDNSSAIAIRIT